MDGLEGPIYYVAGPPAMVAAMREMLTNAGVEEDDIRTEEFGGYSVFTSATVAQPALVLPRR